MATVLPGVTEYTTEILDRNFLLLDSFMNDVAETIYKQSEVIVALGDKLQHVSELAHKAEKATKIVIKARKRSKLVVLGVVAGSVYVGYKYAELKLEEKAYQADLLSRSKKPANTSTIKPETEKD